MKKEREKFFTTKRMTVLASLTAISYVLYMFVKFPLPAIFPSFLDFQVSEMPALIAGFLFGPIEGLIVVLLKCLLKLPFTSTSGVGELADLLLGIGYVLPASLFYRFNKNRKGAAIGLCIGYFSSIILAVLTNYFLLIPFFVRVYGGWDSIIKMLKGLYTTINRENFFKFYLLLGIIPFNALRSLASGFLTFILYKHLSRALKHMFPENKAKRAKEKTTIDGNINLLSENAQSDADIPEQSADNN